MVLDLKIISIPSIEEGNQRVTVKHKISLRWNDARVRFCNLNEVTSHNILTPDENQMVWIPKLMYSNSYNLNLLADAAGFEVEVRPDDKEGKLIYNGSYSGRDHHFIASGEYVNEFVCHFNLRWYPFDTHLCTMEISFQGKEGLFAKVKQGKFVYPAEMDLSYKFLSAQFEILNYEIIVPKDGRSFYCQFTIQRLLTNIIFTNPAAQYYWARHELSDQGVL